MPRLAPTAVYLAHEATYRLRSEWALAHLFASQAVCISRPVDGLCISAARYDWMALDEYAIAAYWTGDCRECRRACEELLSSGLLPADQTERIQRNLGWAQRAIR